MLYVAMFLLSNRSLNGTDQLLILATAAVCTLTEAIAPHGWDNALLQLMPSAILFAYPGGLL